MSYTPEPAYVDHPHAGGGQSASNRTAVIVHTLADIAAAILGLWIVLNLLDANHANVFVQFIEGMANWLAGWSQDIFTMENEQVRFALNYGLPAVAYLFIGHVIAARIRRA